MTSKYAYVSLLMFGESYLPGVKALSASIKASGSKHDFVLMITDDVKVESVAPYVDRVARVKYLKYPSTPMRTQAQRNAYGDWIESSYTKWNCLALTEYSKILFLDLDLIVLRNIDHLFDLPAPAATFSSPNDDSHVAPLPGKQVPMSNLYGDMKHGATVSNDAIRESLKGSYVATASVVLLRPSMEDYCGINRMVMSASTDGKKRGYGWPQCNSGVDEQSIVEYYLTKGATWTHISQIYNMIPWRKNWLPKQGSEPYIYHFIGPKPWSMKRGQWEDLSTWFAFFDKATEMRPSKKSRKRREHNSKTVRV